MVVRSGILAHTVPVAIAGCELTINQDIKALCPNGRIDSRFLFYFLKSRSDELLKLASRGATVHRIMADRIRRIRIGLPPLTEQQRIVRVLDQAFTAIATAKANTEKNLHNARAIFESHLNTVFAQPGEPGGQEPSNRLTPLISQTMPPADDTEVRRNGFLVTRTGGRKATQRHVPGRLSLAVGMPKLGARSGWQWSELATLARLESGHTPSRSCAEYWGGSVPWVGIQDAREHHGHRITDTLQATTELGIQNSSARVLPSNTVCLSRTASVGYVVVLGRPMATSQDFVNWVCSDRLIPDFLKYLFMAEGRDGLLRFASGSVHQTIYFPEAKAFHVCHPEPAEQMRVVRQCDAIRAECDELASEYKAKLAALDELRQSLLQSAFAGSLWG